jgi:hypothetical protein
MRDTIDMAREAGIEFQHITGILGKETISTMGSQRLERIEQLVALVRADEREECAKVAEDSDHVVSGRGYYDQLGDADATVRNIVAAIRARSNT